MKKHLMFAMCLVLVIAIASPLLAQEVRNVDRQWTIGGVERTAKVFVPEEAKQTPSPVIFAFHGHGGTAKNSSRWNYQQLWPEAIVVYMQGLNTPGRLTDPEGKKAGWQSAAGDQDDRDLRFFDAVLESLKSEFKVDEQRIYATGHSNGGGFTYLLWGQRGEVFAAVAPSAAAANRIYGDLKPKPAMHIAGENDTLVKFAWQENAMQQIRKINGCDDAATPWTTMEELV